MFNVDQFLENGKVIEEPYYKVYYDGGLDKVIGRIPEPAHLIRIDGFWQPSDQIMFEIRKYLILRYTPCGAWINTYQGAKFVNLRANKQWACVTEEEAFDQLYYRKLSQIRIITDSLANAKAVKASLEKHFNKKEPRRRNYSNWEY